MRWTIVAMTVALLVVGSCAVSMLWPFGGESRPGTTDQASLTPSERALALVEREIAGADPGDADTPTDWLADAEAWVAANRNPDWPYADLEAWSLGRLAELAEGRAVAPRWNLDDTEHQIDIFKAMDLDEDGILSDEEVASYAEYQTAMIDTQRHPYLIERFDANGDGVLGPEETPWMDAELQIRRRQAMTDRARADLWDTDNDGVVSEDERAAGHAAVLLTAQIFPDGHVEYVPEPGPKAAAEQARVRAQFAEEFGQDALDLILQRQELAAEMYVSIDLARAMTLIRDEVEVERIPDPPMPDSADYDLDGDGSLNAEEFPAFHEAYEAWERAVHLNAATAGAARFRALFDAQREAADTDYDGRILPEEWDAHRARLVADRADRLFDRHYDLDADGSFGPAELETFVEWYRAGSLRADANYDGQVDVDDLREAAERFRADNR